MKNITIDGIQYDLIKSNIKKDYEILEATYQNEPKVDNIISVRRKSDGQRFTVGDRIIYNGQPPNPRKTISKFFMNSKNELLFSFEEDLIYDSGYHFRLLKKYDILKTPLLTTEDGVDIFEGDLFWYPTSDFSTVYKERIPIKTKHSEQSYKNLIEYCTLVSNKKFSTKETAQEYISKNKPQYSEKDMLEFAEVARVKGGILTYNPHLITWFNNWRDGK